MVLVVGHALLGRLPHAPRGKGEESGVRGGNGRAWLTWLIYGLCSSPLLLIGNIPIDAGMKKIK